MPIVRVHCERYLGWSARERARRPRRGSFWICSHPSTLSARRATMLTARVPRMMSGTSENAGHAASTRAPCLRNTLMASTANGKSSGSTGIRPSRSGRPGNPPALNRGPLRRAREPARVHLIGERIAVVGAGQHCEHERDVADGASDWSGDSENVPDQRAPDVTAPDPVFVRNPRSEP
jgi:hypothetical protein